MTEFDKQFEQLIRAWSERAKSARAQGLRHFAIWYDMHIDEVVAVLESVHKELASSRNCEEFKVHEH